jgi:hypothetical protein
MLLLLMVEVIFLDSYFYSFDRVQVDAQVFMFLKKHVSQCGGVEE